LRRPLPELLVSLHVELGEQFPRNKRVASTLFRQIRQSLEQYKFAFALHSSEVGNNDLNVEIDSLIRTSRALLRLLAETNPRGARYAYIPKGEQIGRPALRALPRLLSLRRLTSYKSDGVVLESRVPSIRKDLQWLLERAVSLKKYSGMDWIGMPKPARGRGRVRGSEAIKVELAGACYQALEVAGIRGYTFSQGRRRSSSTYVSLVAWALKACAGKTEKGGHPVGNVAKIARLARERLEIGGSKSTSRLI
jgi:hypothetical protein